MAISLTKFGTPSDGNREELMESLLDARALIWCLDYSALLVGQRFGQVCRSMGMDPHAMAPERRAAIDASLQTPLAALRASPEDLARARLDTLLREMLARPLH